MSMPILNTKLYIPPVQPKIVHRPCLVERLNEGLHRKLTLISAPAGFGKTSLISEWIESCKSPTAWLSLDEGENDPARFLTYLVASLQTIKTNIGAGVLGLLQSPQPPPAEAILTILLNEITAITDKFILVLDDYHAIDAKPVDHILAFLLEHLPPKMHLVIATREDPDIPLARLRTKSQLTELRVIDLRFTNTEAAVFLNKVMNLNISEDDIAALEIRTEGWIAGLQLAAISIRGIKDITGFIKSFTGSHRFVMDYLVEEVLQRQPENIQIFLLQTSILDRLCGPLCDAVQSNSNASGQDILEYLEHTNLFIVPLDDERHWYRYHHLFAGFLRQRRQQNNSTSKRYEGMMDEKELHKRASIWYENNNLETEAFHHAAAANDIEHASYLLEGKGMPLHFRGAVIPVLNWLASLPKTALDAKPLLWVMYASALSMTGQITGVEEKLQAAEASLQNVESNDKTRNLIGHIASIRALLAALNNNVETIITQSQRALKYLHPDNLAVRTAAIWKMGLAFHLKGDRTTAKQAYTEAISISQATGNIMINISSATFLGIIQESDNQLFTALQTYKHVLQLAGDLPQPAASEASLGLARVFYEWNDLETAQHYGQQSLRFACLLENSERIVPYKVFQARLKLAQGDASGAASILAEVEKSVQQYNYVFRMSEIAVSQVEILLHQGNLTAAEQIAKTQKHPIIKARVLLAHGDSSSALAILEPFRQQMEEKDWKDELLKVMILQTLALHANGEKEKALKLLGDVLALAKPGGFIRIFVNEGAPMAGLLSDAVFQGIMPDYISKLLAIFKVEEQKSEYAIAHKNTTSLPTNQTLIEPLSQRELEVLRLIAKGFSNREISERLFLALTTVKGHNQKIFDKLQVQRRTEAVARASELGLL